MLIDMHAGLVPVSEDTPLEYEVLHGTRALYRERKWRLLEPGVVDAAGDFAVSRWTSLQISSPCEEATTPAGRYFIGIALKATRLTLTRGCQTIFDGPMPAGALYVSAPSKQLSARFHAPCDFLHFQVSPRYIFSQRSATECVAADGLNDLVLLRDPLAEQFAKALTERGNTVDEEFARCIGQTLAMHLGRIERPRTRINALPKWRLRRVEEYIKAHSDRCISLADLAGVAGLSRMHFAAQFRAATGYRPREYLLRQRIEQAKSFLSKTEMPLAEIALAVGFCTQAHFSTVFKRIMRETPARWRCASRSELLPVQRPPQKPAYGRAAYHAGELA